LEQNNIIFREKERRPPIVSAKIRSLFGEWASAHRQSNYSREMEEKEELWRDQFQIQQQIGSKVFAPNSSLGEKIKGAYMPSWVLLGMIVVEERVRKRNNKTINKK
jgi:hypothetical protein